MFHVEATALPLTRGGAFVNSYCGQPVRSMGWAGHQGGHGRKGKGPMPMNRPRDSSDESFDVLVLDAGYKQSLASTRSLGRAGLRVVLAKASPSSGRRLGWPRTPRDT